MLTSAKEEKQLELILSHSEAKQVVEEQVAKELDESQDSKLLKENKLILFTVSKETAEYLAKNVNKAHSNEALCFTGGSGEATRQVVIQNFDAKARRQKNDYRILISTEVLSEDVDLHRANVVINYDIPWNPTRMMQRVGRINRVDTKFDTIYTFYFFPTRQANGEIKLKETAEAKINAFLTLLGGDAALLTEGEPVGSHELFNRLVSKKTVTGEDENETSELKYLTLIKDIRDNNPDLFEKIKRLPKKARSAKSMSLRDGVLPSKQSPGDEGIASRHRPAFGAGRAAGPATGGRFAVRIAEGRSFDPIAPFAPASGR